MGPTGPEKNRCDKSLTRPMSKVFLFSSRSFMISGLITRSSFHFKWIFVFSLTVQFFLLHVEIQDSQDHLLSFLRCVFFFGGNGVSLCHLGWSAVAWTRLTAVSASWVQVILSPQPYSSSWDYRHVPPCPGNFCIVSRPASTPDQPELLTSSDLPISASQCAGITSWATVPGP